MYPYQRTFMGNPYINPAKRGSMGYTPQESLENTINTMLVGGFNPSEKY